MPLAGKNQLGPRLIILHLLPPFHPQYNAMRYRRNKIPKDFRNCPNLLAGFEATSTTGQSELTVESGEAGTDTLLHIR